MMLGRGAEVRLAGAVFLAVSAGCGYTRNELFSPVRYARSAAEVISRSKKLMVDVEARPPRGKVRIEVTEEQIAKALAAAAASAGASTAGLETKVRFGGSLEEALTAAREWNADVVLHVSHAFSIVNVPFGRQMMGSYVTTYSAKDVPCLNIRASALVPADGSDILHVDGYVQGKSGGSAMPLVVWKEAPEKVYERALEQVLRRFTNDPDAAWRYRYDGKETAGSLPFVLGAGIVQNSFMVTDPDGHRDFANPILARFGWNFRTSFAGKQSNDFGIHVELDSGGRLAQRVNVSTPPVYDFRMKTTEWSTVRCHFSIRMTGESGWFGDLRLGGAMGAFQHTIEGSTGTFDETRWGFSDYFGFGWELNRAFGIAIGFPLDGLGSDDDATGTSGALLGLSAAISLEYRF